MWCFTVSLTVFQLAQENSSACNSVPSSRPWKIWRSTSQNQGMMEKNNWKKGRCTHEIAPTSEWVCTGQNQHWTPPSKGGLLLATHNCKLPVVGWSKSQPFLTYCHHTHVLGLACVAFINHNKYRPVGDVYRLVTDVHTCYCSLRNGGDIIFTLIIGIAIGSCHWHQSDSSVSCQEDDVVGIMKSSNVRELQPSGGRILVEVGWPKSLQARVNVWSFITAGAQAQMLPDERFAQSTASVPLKSSMYKWCTREFSHVPIHAWKIRILPSLVS